MDNFHFVKDYTAHVESLMAAYPLDEAMSLAVGGDYDLVGDVASEVVRFAAPEARSFLDFGCGSGRVAHHLAKKVDVRAYTGIDIIQPLLDYAVTKTPPHFEFKLNHSLELPVADQSIDCAFAFSVFTHLQQAEIFIYMTEITRCLSPHGVLVFSFLEMASPSHWRVFDETVAALKAGSMGHLNIFTERSQLDCMAVHAGLTKGVFIDGHDARWGGRALGQSIAIMRKTTL